MTKINKKIHEKYQVLRKLINQHNNLSFELQDIDGYLKTQKFKEDKLQLSLMELDSQIKLEQLSIKNAAYNQKKVDANLSRCVHQN